MRIYQEYKQCRVRHIQTKKTSKRYNHQVHLSNNWVFIPFFSFILSVCECTFGESWRKYYLTLWRSKISRYAVARTPIHTSYHCEQLPIHVSLILSSCMSFYYGVCEKVQVGKDHEKAQSERDSHSKNRGGKKPN